MARHAIQRRYRARRSTMPDTVRRTSTTAAADHDWISSGVVKTSLGAFEFAGGYPTKEASRRLHDLRTLNRAVEVYLDQMPVVSWYYVWKGAAEWGAATP